MLLFLTKALHTVIFFAESSAVFLIDWAALTGRVTRVTAAASALILLEGAVLLCNRGVCPLRTYAERLGAARGSVTDIFLPSWLAERIFQIFTPLVILGWIGIATRRVRARRRG